MTKLIGIYKDQEYLSARGVHDDIPYHIIEKNGKFLLEQLTIAIGVGKVAYPIGFFDDEWKGLYSTQIY
jgi:hypothetical protein